MTTPKYPHKISINQYLVDPFITFQVVAKWPTGYGAYVFVADPSPATLQLLKMNSMWGGPTKSAVAEHLFEVGCPENLIGQTVHAWEMKPDQYDWFVRLARITKAYRKDDLIELSPTFTEPSQQRGEIYVD